MVIGGYDPPGDGLGMGNLSKKAEAEMAQAARTYLARTPKDFEFRATPNRWPTRHLRLL